MCEVALKPACEPTDCPRLCVFPPPCAHPRLTAPPCAASCPEPIGNTASAEQILIHCAEHRQSAFDHGLDLTRADREACIHYVQTDYPCRSSHAEFAVLTLGLRNLALKLSRRFWGFSIGIADPEDYVQESAKLLLERIGQYDPSRGAISTWFVPWSRGVSQELAARSLHATAWNGGAMSSCVRFMRALDALNDPSIWPQTIDEWREFGRVVTGQTPSPALLQAFFRGMDGVDYLDEVSPSVLERSRPAGVTEAESWSDELVELLANQVVWGAIKHETPLRIRRMAQRLWLIGAAGSTTAIAEREGVTEQAVGQSLKKAGLSIKQRSSKARLDQQTVRSHVKHLKPKPTRANAT